MEIKDLAEQALMSTLFITHVLKWEKAIELLETQLVRMHLIK